VGDELSSLAPRPPVSVSRMLARTQGDTYDAKGVVPCSRAINRVAGRAYKSMPISSGSTSSSLYASLSTCSFLRRVKNTPGIFCGGGKSAEM
jgi:hypothetical protein